MPFKKRQLVTPAAPPERPVERKQAAQETVPLITPEEYAFAICFACGAYPFDCSCVTPDAWEVVPYDDDYWRRCERCKKPFAVPERASNETRCVVCSPGAAPPEEVYDAIPTEASGTLNFESGTAHATA